MMIKILDIFYSKISPLYDKVKTAVFPLLLAILSLAASLFVFTAEYATRYTVGGAIWCVFLFAVFTLSGKTKIKAIKPIVHIVLLLTSFVLPISVIGNFGRNRINIYNFVVWFFSGAELQPTAPEYLFGFAVAAGYFFSFTLWYFTNRVYRKQIVFIVSLMPYVIFIKAVFPIQYGFVILSAAFNIFIYLTHMRSGIERNGTVGGRKNMLTVYGDFAIALVLLVFIIPKPAETPYYEQFQEVLKNYEFGNFGGSDSTYGRFNTRSGNADAFNRSQLRDLYYAAMETPNYLKIQAYPYYDDEGNYWYVPNDATTDWYKTILSWEGAQENRNINDLADALLRAENYSPGFIAENGFEGDLERLTELAETEDDALYSAVIQAVNFPSNYIAAPNRTISAKNIRSAFEQVRLGGGLFTHTEMNPYARTEVVYYSEDYPKSSGYLDLELVNETDFTEVLKNASDILEENEDDLSPVISAFLANDIYSGAFEPDFNDEGYYYNSRIADLTAEIIADNETDYEKAKSLETYFTEAGFEYVIGFQPPIGSDTAEYFIFDSKTGTCSDFATAFCLMAQYAGLTVRYCEGYIPVAADSLPESFTDTIYDENQQFFIVTSDNAHAYPEVYIGGLWMRFEPTVGSLTSPFSQAVSTANDATETDPVVILAVIIAVIIAAAGFVVFLIMLPTLREIGFAISVRFKKPESALKAIYLRTGAYISNRSRTMTADELAEGAKTLYNSDISGINIPFVNFVFGGESLTRMQIDNAYKTYGQFKKDIKAAKKRAKKERHNHNKD
jgi:transglutaminase-like putative cysteine protease